jgi:hypothetical protein
MHVEKIKNGNVLKPGELLVVLKNTASFQLQQSAESNLDLPGQPLRLTTHKTGKTLIIPKAEPLTRHVMSLPVIDVQAPLNSRAFGFLD